MCLDVHGQVPTYSTDLPPAWLLNALLKVYAKSIINDTGHRERIDRTWRVTAAARLQHIVDRAHTTTWPLITTYLHKQTSQNYILRLRATLKHSPRDLRHSKNQRVEGASPPPGDRSTHLYGDGGLFANSSLRYSSIGDRISVTENGVECWSCSWDRFCCSSADLGDRLIASSAALSSGSASAGHGE